MVGLVADELRDREHADFLVLACTHPRIGRERQQPHRVLSSAPRQFVEEPVQRTPLHRLEHFALVEGRKRRVAELRHACDAFDERRFGRHQVSHDIAGRPVAIAGSVEQFARRPRRRSPINPGVRTRIAIASEIGASMRRWHAD